jgi:chemotaxis protein MotB
MKTILRLVPIGAIALMMTFSSCVSKGKFLMSQGHVHHLEGDSTLTHNELDACNSKAAKLQQDLTDLNSKNGSLQNDMQNLQNSLQSAESSSNKSKMTIAEQAKRLAALENLIQSQKDLMNKLRKTIADALVNFKPDELTVQIKNGKVYVSLQEKLLFKSGSAVVDPKGKQALGFLATVLNNTPDITVDIEGHTDTVPIKNANFADNWALSVGRAASVVRILTNDYGVDPHRITASGRGKFHPVASNDTAEGRTRNRRTEIILSPNLSELYKLLGM